MCIQKERKLTIWPGRMYKVFAYQDEALVGSGYVIVDEKTGAHEPVLTDLQGNYLPVDNCIVRVGEGPSLVYVSGRTH